MASLTIAEFGNPILRSKAKELTHKEISNQSTATLIADMRDLLLTKKLGVGLAAPQVGIDKALAIVAVRPSKKRPDAEHFDLVIINPVITKTFGNKKQLYEGCISGGPGKGGLFAKVPRYRKIELTYNDESGDEHRELFEGLAAHVIQHEVDHLNGVLFVDKVKDTTSYLTYKEYLKYVKEQRRK